MDFPRAECTTGALRICPTPVKKISIDISPIFVDIYRYCGFPALDSAEDPPELRCESVRGLYACYDTRTDPLIPDLCSGEPDTSPVDRIGEYAIRTRQSATLVQLAPPPTTLPSCRPPLCSAIAYRKPPVLYPPNALVYSVIASRMARWALRPVPRMATVLLGRHGWNSPYPPSFSRLDPGVSALPAGHQLATNMVRVDSPRLPRYSCTPRPLQKDYA